MTVNKLKNIVCSQKFFSYFCLLILIVSTLPLLFVGFYNHPTGDDLLYGLNSHLAFEHSHSVLDAVKEAVNGVVDDYTRWQGTYSALFLMRMQPTVFSENLYFLTPFLVLFSLIFGIFYFLKQIGTYILKLNTYEYLGISSLLCFLCIQWVISPGEAFYWFNGSVYYSGFFGLMLVSFGLLCAFLHTGFKKYFVYLLLSEIMIGGGNYLTLLWSMIVLFLLSAILVLKKNKYSLQVIILFVTLLACFAISALAPGNSVRASQSNSLPGLTAIRFSLRQGKDFVLGWTNGWWVLGCLSLSFFIIPALLKSNYRFAFPLLVDLFLFGFFSSLTCPTFYAQSNAGPARALNLSIYGYLLTSYTAFFYTLGYILKKIQGKSFFKKFLCKCNSYKIATIPVLMILFFMQTQYGIQDGTFQQFSTVQALTDLQSGTIFAYSKEYQNRIEYLQTTQEMNIVFSPYRNQPCTVYVGDYADFKDQGSNIAFARWYHKESIIVDYSK